MTDLSDWGGGINQAEAGSDDHWAETDDDDKSRPDNDRCRALSTTGQRCRDSVPTAEAELCPSHSEDSTVITIDDDPAYLIGATAGDIWPNPAENIGGWDEIRSGLQEVSIFHWRN